MYLIVHKKQGKRFSIVSDYSSMPFDSDDRFDVYCGKKGAYRGKKVASKKANKSAIDILVTE